MTKLIPETVFFLSKTNFKGTAENTIIEARYKNNYYNTIYHTSSAYFNKSLF
jgi:hypothetical protein